MAIGDSTFILFILISLILFVQRLFVAGDPRFDFGEWLINYSGGFVRRGLFGQIILHIFNLKEPFAGYTIFFLWTLTYVTIITFLYNFMRKSLFSWSSIVICCSPAVGLFIFENADNMGPRKELLGLFSLVLFSLSSKSQNSKTNFLSWCTIMLFGFSCFSSEINALFLPSFLYVLKASSMDSNLSSRIRIQRASLVVISFVSFVLSTLFHGNPQIAKVICADVISHGVSKYICGDTSSWRHYGAIDWIKVPVAQVFPIVGTHFPLYFYYFPLIALAIFPIVSTPWFRTQWKWCLACATFILPLYVGATDYGRWTFMLATEVVIMIVSTKHPLIENLKWNRFSATAFIFCWGLPFYAHPKSNFRELFFNHNFLSRIFWTIHTDWARFVHVVIKFISIRVLN